MRTLLAAALIVTVLPFVAPPRERALKPVAELPWPEPYRSMRPLPVTGFERQFAESAGARVARFQSPDAEYLVRWLTEPDRRIHPPEQCFRAAGWIVTASTHACFQASRSGARLEVCQSITDDHGHAWTDVGAWWWSAQFSRSTGPWLSIVSVRPIS
jgi:hypothetical protein